MNMAVLRCTRRFFIPQLMTRSLSQNVREPPDNQEPPLPQPKQRVGESTELKRSRLLYQSRKRGMLENGLLLSTFADKYLEKLNDSQLAEYDNLINIPSNDWEIYYWIVGTKPTPAEYDNSVMDMLKNHARNDDMESRIRQPDLPEVEKY